MVHPRRKTHASAPSRVDLAGGTLDIWPLNLLVDRAVTVNVAIDRRAHAEVWESGDRAHRIHAEDIDREVVLDLGAAAGRAGERISPGLPLHEAVLRHLAPAAGFEVVTRSDVPAGSGLGGSSALAVSLLAALMARTGVAADRDAIALLARDLEAQVLEIPTGTQDHLAALHGGLAAIHYGPGPSVREPLPLDIQAFESRSLLAFLGASRVSARANWDMVRRALDGDAATRRGLQAIAAIAGAMRVALLQGDLDEGGRLLAAEWEERRGLSPEVSTPETERAIASAREAGAAGGKICGAGGGGCLFVMGPPDARGRIAAALQASGCRLLDFHLDTRGLEVATLQDRDA